jgi:hypothetical protein
VKGGLKALPFKFFVIHKKGKEVRVPNFSHYRFRRYLPNLVKLIEWGEKE